MYLSKQINSNYSFFFQRLKINSTDEDILVFFKFTEFITFKDRNDDIFPHCWLTTESVITEFHMIITE